MPSECETMETEIRKAVVIIIPYYERAPNVSHYYSCTNVIITHDIRFVFIISVFVLVRDKDVKYANGKKYCLLILYNAVVNSCDF